MKRKEFLNTIVTAALGVSALPITSLRSSPVSPKISVGIIGSGRRGTGLIHMIKDIPELEVKACADVIPFRLENAVNLAGNCKGYADYRALLDQKDIDAVIIATPFSEHYKVARDSMAADKHVYCEKTLAKGYTNILDLVNRKKNTTKIFQTGHQYHSSRLYTHIAQLLKEHKVGKIHTVKCQWNRNGNWRRKVKDESFNKMINWRMYREFSGGLLAELSSHQIDFCNWILGSAPKSVIGVGGIDYWKDGRETYDNIHTIYTYPNGVKATFTCLTANAMNGYEIKVLGDKGTITMGMEKAWFMDDKKHYKINKEVDGMSGATAQWNDQLGTPINYSHLNPTRQALIDFKNSMLTNAEPISDINTGARTALSVQMGLQAMYTGSETCWDPTWNTII